MLTFLGQNIAVEWPTWVSFLHWLTTGTNGSAWSLRSMDTVAKAAVAAPTTVVDNVNTMAYMIALLCLLHMISLILLIDTRGIIMNIQQQQQQHQAADVDADDDEERVRNVAEGVQPMSAWSRLKQSVANMSRTQKIIAVISVAILIVSLIGLPIARIMTPNEETVAPVFERTNEGMVEYHWRRFGQSAKSEQMLPVIMCAYHTAVEELQQLVLPASEPVSMDTHTSELTIPSSGRHIADPAQELRQRLKQYQERDVRVRAKSMCYMPPEPYSLLPRPLPNPVMADTFGVYLSMPSLFELVETASIELVDSAKVEHVLITRNGERYYRIVMATRNLTSMASTDNNDHNNNNNNNNKKYPYRALGGWSLTPQLVTEQELLRAVRTWWKFAQSVSSKSIACLCAAHFGIVGSHLHFYYDSTVDDWRLMWQTEVVKYNTNFPMFTTSVEYSDYRLHFPRDVDKSTPLLTCVYVSEYVCVSVSDCEHVLTT